MANTKSSKKFIIQSKFQRRYNSSNRSKLKTFIKKINTAIQNKDKSLSASLFIIIQKTIDRQILKGLIHKNKASRYKSKIHKRLNSIHSNNNENPKN